MDQRQYALNEAELKDIARRQYEAQNANNSAAIMGTAINSSYIRAEAMKLAIQIGGTNSIDLLIPNARKIAAFLSEG